MFNASESVVHVVAADSRNAVAEYDAALMAALRLAANVVDGMQGSKVPAGQSQRLYRSLNDSLGKLTEGRGMLVSAISQMQVLHKHSNQAEVDAGCAAPWHQLSGAAKHEPSVAANDDAHRALG